MKNLHNEKSQNQYLLSLSKLLFLILFNSCVILICLPHLVPAVYLLCFSNSSSMELMGLGLWGVVLGFIEG